MYILFPIRTQTLKDNYFVLRFLHSLFDNSAYLVLNKYNIFPVTLTSTVYPQTLPKALGLPHCYFYFDDFHFTFLLNLSHVL